jgi:hypothetical protein
VARCSCASDYAKGSDLIGAAEIFRSLRRGERHEFGTMFGELLELIGGLVAYRGGHLSGRYTTQLDEVLRVKTENQEVRHLRRRHINCGNM